MDKTSAFSFPAPVDYSTASWDELLLWFRKLNFGRITCLNELCNGVVYCNLVGALFPDILDQRQVRANPGSLTERAINWKRLEYALNAVTEKDVDILERIRPYGIGNLDFCRWFISFVEANMYRALRQRSPSRDDDRRPLNTYRNSINGYFGRPHIYTRKFLDDGVSKYGEYDFWNGASIAVSEVEKDLLEELREQLTKKNSITSKEIVQMLGAKKGEMITRAMIAKWKTGQNKIQEQIPSIWDYNERRLPKEIADLDPRKFLHDAVQRNLCFLPTDVLNKICEKLPPSAFINLSLTCRYLHWRMFTFTKCYVPLTASATMQCLSIQVGKSYEGQLKDLYFSEKQLKGIFITGPAVLKKPFVFERLELTLMLDFFGKTEYDRHMQYIVPFRQRCARLIIIFRTWHITDRAVQLEPFNYSDTNDFFKGGMVKADGYRGKNDIFFKCSYARQMKDVHVTFRPLDLEKCQLYPQMALENRRGCYSSPTYETLIDTIMEFLSGNSTLEFHAYSFDSHSYWNGDLDDEDKPEKWKEIYLKIRIFLFTVFPHLDEFYSITYEHVWLGKIAAGGTGKILQLKIIISSWSRMAIMIGKDEMFDEMEKRSKDFLHGVARDRGEEKIWKMETAVEWTSRRR